MAYKIPKVVILSDSLLKHASLPGVAEVHCVRGATFSTLKEGVDHDRYIKDWKAYNLVIIHCGTNDIDNGNQKNILKETTALVAKVQKRNTELKFIISSILPRPKDFETTNPIIKRVNEVLKVWSSSKKHVIFAPTYKTFFKGNQIRTDQVLFDEDKLHLNEQGSLRMVRILKSLVHRFEQDRLNFNK